MRVQAKALKKLLAYVTDKGLLKPEDKVLLAVSGGSDSVALMYLFATLRSYIPVTLLAVHVNHGLRGADSDADEALVRLLCLRLNVPLIVRKINLTGGSSLEDRARNKRFGIFSMLLDLYGFDYVALGHQKQDQAETILMNLLRGAGINGMAGIKPRHGKVLHPLLDFTREELQAILVEADIPWREDTSNADMGFRRNRIRAELLPMLAEEYNPQAINKLALQGEIFAGVEELLVKAGRSHLKKCALEIAPHSITINVDMLSALSKVEMFYTIRCAFALLKGDNRDFFNHSFQEIIGILGSEGSKQSYLQHGIKVYRNYGELVITAAEPECGPIENVYVEEDRARVVYRDFRFTFRHLKVKPQIQRDDPYSVIIDPDKIGFPVQIRSRKAGDRFIPLGMREHKKLKEFFIDAKVARLERDAVPILDDGEKIIWVVGHRIDERVKIDDTSTRYLHISVEPVRDKPKRAANRVKKQGEERGQDELRYFGSVV